MGWFGASIGSGLKQCPENGHTCDAVGQYMMNLDQQAEPIVRESGKEPHLPEWPGLVKTGCSQLLRREQKLRFITGSWDCADAYVVAEIERRRIYPDRLTQTSSWSIEELTKPRYEVQPPGYESPRVFDSKATLWVDQACAVEHSQAADLLRPQLIGPQHDHVFSGQSVHS
jgi:hypothetical protein